MKDSIFPKESVEDDTDFHGDGAGEELSRVIRGVKYHVECLPEHHGAEQLCPLDGFLFATKLSVTNKDSVGVKARAREYFPGAAIEAAGHPQTHSQKGPGLYP